MELLADVAAAAAHGPELEDEVPDLVSDTSSESGDDTGPFFSPVAECSLAHKRAKWERLLGRSVGHRGGVRSTGPKKRRKVEEKPREGRYAYLFEEGDPRRFKLDPDKSLWWDLLNNPSVGDESSAAGRKFRHKFRLPYAMAMALVNEAQQDARWHDKPAGPAMAVGGHATLSCSRCSRPCATWARASTPRQSRRRRR